MKKRTTNRTADAVAQALADISSSNIECSVKIGYWIAKNTDAVNHAVETYRKERDGIIAGMAPDGKTIKQEDNPELFDECARKLNELDNIKVEVDVYPLKLADVKDLNIPMKYMFALAFILEG